jgi:hypothetical protein
MFDPIHCRTVQRTQIMVDQIPENQAYWERRFSRIVVSENQISEWQYCCLNNGSICV